MLAWISRVCWIRLRLRRREGNTLFSSRTFQELISVLNWSKRNRVIGMRGNSQAPERCFRVKIW